MRPTQTRDGYPVRMGPDVMPGPADTYIAYGRGWANVCNTPFREYKHWVHEGGISTPLIAHWPAGIKRRGELGTQPGHLIDIMATCVDLAGATYPRASYDGAGDSAAGRQQPRARVRRASRSSARPSTGSTKATGPSASATGSSSPKARPARGSCTTSTATAPSCTTWPASSRSASSR